MGEVYNWRDKALCWMDSRFIKKPDPETEQALARVCSKCDVIQECYKWISSESRPECFAAGEWWGSGGEGNQGGSTAQPSAGI